jgi:hypothetical protein
VCLHGSRDEGAHGRQAFFDHDVGVSLTALRRSGFRASWDSIHTSDIFLHRIGGIVANEDLLVRGLLTLIEEVSYA